MDDPDHGEDSEGEHQEDPEEDPEDDHQEELKKDLDKKRLDDQELKDSHLTSASGPEEFDLNRARSTSPKIVADYMDSEGQRAVVAVMDLQVGKIQQLQEAFDENGERLIVIQGQKPMTLEMIRRQIAHDGDLLAHLLKELPKEEVDLALQIGALEYEMRAREAALLEKLLEEQNRSAM